MTEFLTTYYEWIRAFHIIAVMAWVAGLLYLPRLFVYHAQAAQGSELSETFKIMERRLYKIIMNPAMMAAWVFGGAMLYVRWEYFMTQGWMHGKLTLIILMTGLHHVMGKYVKIFAADKNEKSAKFFRILNEIPTALMILIIILAVAEPF